MKNRILILCLLLLQTGHLFGENNLYLYSPSMGIHFPCNIKETEIKVRPLGSYVEYELFLTVEGSGFSYQYWNTVLKLLFELPENSFITDAWYWYGDVPLQATLLNRRGVLWEETSREYSYFKLLKEDRNQYTLSMYPLNYAETKKFKITYLSPAKYFNEELMIEIPTNILATSINPPEKIIAYFTPSAGFEDPTSTNEAIKFVPATLPENRHCLSAEIPNSEIELHQITIKRKQANDLIFSTFEDGSDQYYQLSFTPSNLFPSPKKPENCCFLIDYNSTSANQNSKNIISQIIKNYELTKGDKDSFNVIYSSLRPKPIGEHWLSSTHENIQNSFNSEKVTNYSNLIPLLSEGINFLNQQDGTGKIILVTNNYNLTGEVKEVIDDIESINRKKVEISIIDFSDVNTSNYYDNNYYYNSGYLFSQLAQNSSGRFIQFISEQNMYSSDFNERFKFAFNELFSNRVTTITVEPKTSNCVGIINVPSELTNEFLYNDQITQLGRFLNEPPVSFLISMEVNGKYYSENFSVNSTTAEDTTLKIIWNAIDLAYLEENYNDNTSISRIISGNIKHQILGKYTAFMNKDVPQNVCIGCENIPTGDIKIEPKLKTYPNPFTSTIDIDITEGFDYLSELKVFNLLGKCVKTFNTFQNQSMYTWDGITDKGVQAEKGIYLVVATYANNVLTTKIMKN